MTDWELGLLAFREGRTREAVDRLEAAAAETELTVSRAARFETLAHLGAAQYALGRPGDAARAFEGARRLRPASAAPPDLLLNLAHAYLADGRRADARAALSALLGRTPGHVAARMLLRRLDNTPPDQPVTGAVLGDSVESVKQYLRTLTFESVGAGGYDPAQVREALSQVERYIDSLDQQLSRAQTALAAQEDEIARLRQTEEVLIQNMVAAQQGANGHPSDPDAAQLSPIEILFQKKS